MGWGCSSEAPETRAGWLAGLLAPETTHPPTQLFPRQLAAKLGVSARWNLDFSPFSSFSPTDRRALPSTRCCVWPLSWAREWPEIVGFLRQNWPVRPRPPNPPPRVLTVATGSTIHSLGQRHGLFGVPLRPKKGMSFLGGRGRQSGKGN